LPKVTTGTFDGTGIGVCFYYSAIYLFFISMLLFFIFVLVFLSREQFNKELACLICCSF